IGEHDWLTVDAFLGDYIHDLPRIPTADGTRLYLFLGSTLGNFDEREAIEFLRTLRSVIGMHDWFLLGVDRVKDVDVLRAAYNDAAGLTAEFNRNALHVINRALAGEFDPQAFAHRAEYNESGARIEMYLDSLTPQIVRIRKLDMEVEFAEGEPILTEISRKFTRSAVEGLLEAGGFSLQRWFEPENRFFSLVLARPTGAA
ncbi:MAG: L-histidine N(alpha)-methyltransferase, partial [Acidiferrobacterales bacterium]